MLFGVCKDTVEHFIGVGQRDIIVIVRIIFGNIRGFSLSHGDAGQIIIMAAVDVDENDTPPGGRKSFHDFYRFAVKAVFPIGRVTPFTDDGNAGTGKRASVLERNPVGAVSCRFGSVYQADGIIQSSFIVLVRIGASLAQ